MLTWLIPHWRCFESSQREVRDFAGGPVVKNPPATAGDMGSISGLGRFHLLQSNKDRGPQLPKPTHLEPVLPTREATAMRSPQTATRE